MIVKFPDLAFRRREVSRRPRRSKNGTPEERSAKAPLLPSGPRQRRWSKNGTPEERAAKKLSAKVIDVTAHRAKRAERAAASLPPPLTNAEFAAAFSELGAQQKEQVARAIAAINQRLATPPDPPSAA